MPILKAGQKPNTPPPSTSKPGQSKAPTAPKRDAFAERYANTEAATGGGWTPPPAGTYNALVTEAQGEVDGDKTSAYFEVTIVDHEELAGKTCRIYFNFTDENGQEMQGMPHFRAAMEMLGQSEPPTSWDDMCEKLAGIAQDQMWVIIDVKKRGKYTNIYFSSVPENQNEKPALPE